MTTTPSEADTTVDVAGCTYSLPFNARERGTFYLFGKAYHWARTGPGGHGRAALRGPDPRTTSGV